MFLNLLDFWTGKRQIFKFLAIYVLCTQKYQNRCIFCFSIAQIPFRLTEVNYFSHIQVDLSKLGIFKNISSPGNKILKSRYRDTSRRLRNTVLADLMQLFQKRIKYFIFSKIIFTWRLPLLIFSQWLAYIHLDMLWPQNLEIVFVLTLFFKRSDEFLFF